MTLKCRIKTSLAVLQQVFFDLSCPLRANNLAEAFCAEVYSFTDTFARVHPISYSEVSLVGICIVQAFAYFSCT